MSHNITIHGYLVETPEIAQVNPERDALNFTVASTRTWPDGKGGTNEKTEFFDCVCYRKRGKFNGLMQKGRFVKGTEIRINRAYMETSKNETPERIYYNSKFVVDGLGNPNSPALEIISTKAERDFLKAAIEQGQLVNAPAQNRQAA